MKIGRNEKCPCGSKKKYKNCCLLENQTSPSNVQTTFDNVDVLHGFTKEFADCQPFEIDFEKSCCLVVRASEQTVNEQNKAFGLDFLKAGDWFVIGEINGQTKASYKYENSDEAMTVAKEKFNAIRFLSPPEFI